MEDIQLHERNCIETGLCIFFLIGCCSMIDCEGEKFCIEILFNSCTLYSGVPMGISDFTSNCDLYGNDLKIISKFPSKMNLDPQKQGWGISTAFLDITGSSVIMIQLRQGVATVPDSLFYLKHLQSLNIKNMNFIDSNGNLHRLLIMEDCWWKMLCQIFHSCCSVLLQRTHLSPGYLCTNLSYRSAIFI